MIGAGGFQNLEPAEQKGMRATPYAAGRCSPTHTVMARGGMPLGNVNKLTTAWVRSRHHARGAGPP